MQPDIYETGLSDHHKMVYSFLKKSFAKGKLEAIYYRCLKNFDQNKLMINWKEEFELICTLKHFLKSFKPLWRDSLLINKKQKYAITTILSWLNT